jgi:hypothetical protein
MKHDGGRICYRKKLKWKKKKWKWKTCYVQACGQHFRQLGGLKAFFVNVISVSNNHF